MKVLSHLKKGERGIIKKMHGELLSARLLEMGMLPGREVQFIRSAPFGNPLYLKIAGHYLSIRKEEAENIVLQ